ncbi:MAG: TIGR04283 family arsenosugar biosynthesis glycosyltransferase [Hyphomicrobiaceae bacterium]
MGAVTCSAMLTVIIPTLNAQAGIKRTLASLHAGLESGLVQELIVVDGGSNDGTQRIVEEAGARVVVAERGRGKQLRTGAEEARRADGDWFLFLHADTALEDGWADEVERFITAQSASQPVAAVFRFALDDSAARARIMERLVALRCEALGLPYGDQGLLISFAHYRDTGGYTDMPLMEDVDIVRRIGRKNLTFLKSRAVTSAVRYQKYGYILRAVRNLMCLTLYFLRVPPRVLVRLYG